MLLWGLRRLREGWGLVDLQTVLPDLQTHVHVENNAHVLEATLDRMDQVYLRP